MFVPYSHVEQVQYNEDAHKNTLFEFSYSNQFTELYHLVTAF